MARGLTRKQLKQDEVLKAAFSAEQWIEDHWPTLVKWLGAIALIAIVLFAWFWWSGRRVEQAQGLLAQGLEQYDAARAGEIDASYESALALFEDAAGKGGGSLAGTTATYYRGASLMRLERADEAVPFLEEASQASVDSLATVASMMLADAYAKSGRTDEAISTLRRLGDRTDPYGEQALLKLGFLLRETGDVEGAREALQDLLDRNPIGGAGVQASRLIDQLGG